MIIGIGTDIMKISRIEKACEKEAFLNRVYTQQEQEYAHGRAQTLAAMFAAKEAGAKALGTGFNGFGFRNIEVCHTAAGQPFLYFTEGAARRKEEIHGGRSYLSLSHEDQYAVAFVVLEGEENQCSF